MTTETDTWFDHHQRATVEAAMARIIPTDDLPGAREAGTVDFLDRYLSGIDFIYAKPDGSGFETLSGRSAVAWTRRVELARQKYDDGVRELDRQAQALAGVDFVGLTDAQQDRVLAALERGVDAGPELAKPEVPYGIEPALQQTNAESELDFFSLLVTHTRQGFLSDPIYGGNRDHIGWQVIGFPGPASLAEVHSGRYSTSEYFADDRRHPTPHRQQQGLNGQEDAS
ncbi:gluconate 2-dehydrogenase subunit 3 family protein [Microlunatus spumicola]|uniref:Gluconate 2-dehydrogenase subunit 3 family protein n=1 Tax=Microlunatus spumicola TaxID=81499 RepID=A0ABP6XMR6_9ACTN